MVCNTCGRHTQNETANFCEYCGASFREQAQREAGSVFGQPINNTGWMPGPGNNPMGAFARPMQQNTSTTEKPITFLEWLGSYLLLIVPFVNIIMLFIWAFSYNTPVTKRNWARVTLIAMAILFVLFIAYMLYIMSTPLFQEMYQMMMQDYGLN